MLNYATLYKYHNSLNNFIFLQQIKNDNVQGACGILQVKNIPEDIEEEKDDLYCRDIIVNNRTNKVFYKYGNNGYNCTLERQEHVVAVDLNNNCRHLPNFTRPFLYLKNHFINRNSENPFYIKDIPKNKLGCVDVATFEFLDFKQTFYKLIKDKNISNNVKYSLIMQICIAIICAQQNCDFVHNDLHGNNIVILNCPKEIKIIYKVSLLNEYKYFLVNTYGYIPVIIDYGFSYSKECEGMSVECIDTDNNGYISYKFDSISDFIRFFIVFNGCIKDTEVNTYIKNLFSNLPIDIETSREKIVKRNSMEYIEEIIINNYSKYIGVKVKKGSNYLYQLSRFFVRSITLPIEQRKEASMFNVNRNMKKFFRQWLELEKWCAYNYEKTYLQREYFDAVRKTNNKEELFTRVHNIFSEILGKNVPINIDWDELYDSTIKCIVCFENILFNSITLIDNKRKNRIYSKLKSVEYMVNELFEKIYHDKHTIKPGDIILFIDNSKRSNTLYNVTKEYINITAEEIIEELEKNEE